MLRNGFLGFYSKWKTNNKYRARTGRDNSHITPSLPLIFFFLFNWDFWWFFTAVFKIEEAVPDLQIFYWIDLLWLSIKAKPRHLVLAKDLVTDLIRSDTRYLSFIRISAYNWEIIQIWTESSFYYQIIFYSPKYTVPPIANKNKLPINVHALKGHAFQIFKRSVLTFWQ